MRYKEVVKKISVPAENKIKQKQYIENGRLPVIDQGSKLIGGSDGILESIKSNANMCLSFSKMTMPHGLFRGILLEQIYRSFKINNNETYHK